MSFPRRTFWVIKVNRIRSHTYDEIRVGPMFSGRLPEAVLFDVDGTLYDHGKVKRAIAWEFAVCLLRDLWSGKQMLLVRQFRNVREELAKKGCKDIEFQQYRLAAARSGTDVEAVKLAVGEWMFERPLRHIARYRYPGIGELFALLKDKGIKTAVVSDYPLHAKLAALGLCPDISVSAVDPEVDRLKPDPKGILVVMARLGLQPHECLYIGDREDKDGECCRRAGVPFMLLGKNIGSDRGRAGRSAAGFYPGLIKWVKNFKS